MIHPAWAGFSEDSPVSSRQQPRCSKGLLLAQAPLAPHSLEPGPVPRLREGTRPGGSIQFPDSLGDQEELACRYLDPGRRGKGVSSACPSYRSSLELVGAVFRLAKVPFSGVPQVSIDGDVDLGVRPRPRNVSCEDLHRVQHNWAGGWTDRKTDRRTKGRKGWHCFRFGETGFVGGIILLAQTSGGDLVSSFYLLIYTHSATSPSGFTSGKFAHLIWTQAASKTQRMETFPRPPQTIQPSSHLQHPGERQKIVSLVTLWSLNLPALTH